MGAEAPAAGAPAPGRRGLVVGQAPPRPAERLPEGYLPLQGGPEKRLARLAGLASPAALWADFDRLDLIGWCPGPKDRKAYHAVKSGYGKHNRDGHRFPLRDARLAAGRLVRFGGLARDYSMVVLCGRSVAAAFGLRLRPRVPWTAERCGVRYLVLPHPSGASHFWNDEVSWHRAAQVFREALRAARLCAPPPPPLLPPAPVPPSLPAAPHRRRGAGSAAAPRGPGGPAGAEGTREAEATESRFLWGGMSRGSDMPDGAVSRKHRCTAACGSGTSSSECTASMELERVGTVARNIEKRAQLGF